MTASPEKNAGCLPLSLKNMLLRKDGANAACGTSCGNMMRGGRVKKA